MRRLATVGVALLTAGACTSPPARTPVPLALVEEVALPGLAQARTWAGEPPPFLEDWLNESTEELRERFGGIMDREHTYLAIF